jgi:hypothetical protein
MLSFLSGSDPLIRAGLGSGPNSGLRAGLTGLVLFFERSGERPLLWASCLLASYSPKSDNEHFTL